MFWGCPGAERSGGPEDVPPQGVRPLEGCRRQPERQRSRGMLGVQPSKHKEVPPRAPSRRRACVVTLRRRREQRSCARRYARRYAARKRLPAGGPSGAAGWRNWQAHIIKRDEMQLGKATNRPAGSLIVRTTRTAGGKMRHRSKTPLRAILILTGNTDEKNPRLDPGFLNRPCNEEGKNYIM